jgi:hypothetical protein
MRYAVHTAGYRQREHILVLDGASYGTIPNSQFPNPESRIPNPESRQQNSSFIYAA